MKWNYSFQQLARTLERVFPTVSFLISFHYNLWYLCIIKGLIFVISASEDSSNAAALHTMSSINSVAAEHQSPPHIPSQRVNQPPKPKLEGVLVNHNEPRSSSKIGLRVHFKLPEDDKESESPPEDGLGTTNQTRPNYFQDRINGQPVKVPEPTSPSKEPPPVLAKPKL